MTGNVDPITEIACCFGEGSQLTGVYTPAPGSHRDKPCMVYLTAGLLHHIGPTRLHVEMARALANDHVSGFRFDLSGVGDSETSALGGYFQERSVSEIRQALNYLQASYGCGSFVLVGLCSGADDALVTAAKDQRVTGLVLLNGYAYRAGYFWLFRFLKFYLPRLLMPEKLLGKLKRLVTRLANRDSDTALVDQRALDKLDSNYRYIPPREETEDLLVRLEREQTDMLLVYTGSEHEEYTYGGQLFAMFPQLRHSPYVKELYASRADHTFILEADREKLIGQVRTWYAKAPFKRVPLHLNKT
ncbi:MAG: alpha/beta fold hydrolase [Granulosicoccus sp.]